MREIELILSILKIWLGIACLLLTVSSYRSGERWSVRCKWDMDAQFVEMEKEDDET